MTVKELIKKLEKYKNQDAELNIISNLTNIDDEEYDVNDCTIDLMQQDIYNDVYDVIIYDNLRGNPLF